MASLRYLQLLSSNPVSQTHLVNIIQQWGVAGGVAIQRRHGDGLQQQAQWDGHAPVQQAEQQRHHQLSGQDVARGRFLLVTSSCLVWVKRSKDWFYHSTREGRLFHRTVCERRKLWKNSSAIKKKTTTKKTQNKTIPKLRFKGFHLGPFHIPSVTNTPFCLPPPLSAPRSATKPLLWPQRSVLGQNKGRDNWMTHSHSSAGWRAVH